MFGRIVVGTDGSETASEAVERAIELAKLSGAKLGIVSAVEPTDRLAPDPLHVVYARDVGLSLDSAAGKAKKEGLEVQTHPRVGNPADAILDVAEETAADLIVVGNKGMTGSKRFLLGSVPDKISHHAPCGVWIVRTT
jgi:nucleotide-binding universal stress UspA family protein